MNLARPLYDPEAQICLIRDCIALGARSTTIMFMTGLTKRRVLRYLTDPASRCRGNLPYRPDEWLFDGVLQERLHAAVLIARYRRIVRHGYGPAEALISAYRHCLAQYGSAKNAEPDDGPEHVGFRLNFDRAFGLVSHLEGRWVAKAPTIGVIRCSECSSEYVHPTAKAGPTGRCPSCESVQRYAMNRRFRDVFPARVIPDQADCQLQFVRQILS